MADPDRILTARLDGTARRLLDEGLPRQQAVAELHAITTRTDLLTHTAGTALGAWQHNDTAAWQGRDVALLLVDAGADPDAVKERAAVVRDYLSRQTGLGGIGNASVSPSSREPRSRSGPAGFGTPGR